jgi:hypothetical protein
MEQHMPSRVAWGTDMKSGPVALVAHRRRGHEPHHLLALAPA